MKPLNKILLRRKNKIIIENKKSHVFQNKTEKAFMLSMIKNFESLGFSVSADLLEKLGTLSLSQMKVLYKDIIVCLKEKVGADKQYTPMYPNFPDQVMNADDAELILNAVFHYLSSGTIMPQYEKDERFPLIDDNKMTLLSVGTREDIMEIFSNLVSSKTSLSDQDKQDIETIVDSCSEYYKYLPDEIPLKENVAFISKLILEKDPIASAKTVCKYFKTATDVLRFVIALSDGDISLATRTKCRSLKRKERRFVMTLLSGCGNLVEDMFRYRSEWLHVARFLHPFEYTFPVYKDVISAFDILHNHKKPLMFAGRVQQAIVRKDIKEAVSLLKSRPGDFARQLDKVLRDASDKNYVINCFKEIAEEISTPVLLQVYQHFSNRASEDKAPVRVCFPKGNLAKAFVISNDLPEISVENCNIISRICKDALVKNYLSKDYMGNIYLDPDFKNYIVPFSQRSASKTVKSVTRGSKIPIKETATAVRGFIWWTNDNGFKDRWVGDRVDIDLTAAIYDSDWNYLEHVSYTSLRSAKYKACHSGDITNGGDVKGKGVAEFIDVDIPSVGKRGRYIVYQVYSFTGQRFSDLPNVRFGWMERDDVNSGEIFEPSTVVMSMDITSESTVAIPVIFDCLERKFIWCDMNLGLSSVSHFCFGNNIESNLRGVTATCYGMTHLNKPNLYDLVMFNAIARGNIVEDRNNADIIFSNDTTAPYKIVNVKDDITGQDLLTMETRKDVPIITAFDTDYFMGQLL